MPYLRGRWMELKEWHAKATAPWQSCCKSRQKSTMQRENIDAALPALKPVHCHRRNSPASDSAHPMIEAPWQRSLEVTLLSPAYFFRFPDLLRQRVRKWSPRLLRDMQAVRPPRRTHAEHQCLELPPPFRLFGVLLHAQMLLVALQHEQHRSLLVTVGKQPATRSALLATTRQRPMIARSGHRRHRPRYGCRKRSLSSLQRSARRSPRLRKVLHQQSRTRLSERERA